MRTLVLLRHAKALPDSGSGDFERGLAPEGVEAATRLGRFLAGAGFAPDLLLTSPARRARQTTDSLCAAAGWAGIPVEERPFYESSPKKVVSVLRELSGSIRTVVIVGHDPTWSALASQLAGGGDLRLPTGAAAALRLELEDWSDLGKDAGELAWLLPPKLLLTTAI